MIGTHVGQYRLLELLGEGGMGSVFLAEHRLLQSRHAIKLLHPDLSKREDLVQRFINEGRAASALQHPNIVQVRDVGQVDSGGPWYLVMDFLQGRTLRQVIADHGGPLPPHRIARLIDDVLHALHAAHERLIVHRDMKPDNIMISPVDDPDLVEKATVLDFGVARLGHGAAVVTLAGAVIGTPQYMAPEQLRGSAVDHRADLWAVGAIAYEMATGGWLPYHDRAAPEGYLTGAEILYRMMTQRSVDPRQRCAQISEELAAVIGKALELDPANRYASARAFALVLAAAVPAEADQPSGMQILERRAKALCGIDDLTETLRSPPPAAIPTPGIASRYELGPLLGAGGMAEVFLAHALGAEGFSRPVALKRVASGFSEQPAFASMFIDEARISARLAHPNVVQVFDFNRDETGRLFLVMEYVAGKDLASLAETGILPTSVAIFIIIEVLRGLGYAHALPNADGTRGVVHRDVSPQKAAVPAPMHTTLASTASQVIGKISAPWRRTRILGGAAVAAVAAIAAFLVALWIGRRGPDPAEPVAAGNLTAKSDAAVGSAIPVRDAAAIAMPSEAAAILVTPDAAVVASGGLAAGPTDAGTEPGKRTEMGSIAVYAAPWALVFIDGKPYGETPVRARLPVGVHRVRLQNDTKDRTVTVTVTTAKEHVIDETL